MDISPLARAVIKRGTILHSDEFDYVDHGKMFVVMGEDDTQLYGFFFINSDILIWRSKRFDGLICILTTRKIHSLNKL